MAFSKNEARPQYNVKVLTENFDKENKLFKIYADFIPNPKRTTLTGKFYARHDSVDLSQADQELLDLIKNMKDRKPREKYPAPVVESHVCGWYPEPLVPLRKMDRRYYHPRVRSISLINFTIKKK